MEEVELRKTRGKEANTVIYQKIMSVIINDTIRGIVKAVNELNIKKDDIVTLVKENGQFVLIYYKD